LPALLQGVTAGRDNWRLEAPEEVVRPAACRLRPLAARSTSGSARPIALRAVVASVLNLSTLVLFGTGIGLPALGHTEGVVVGASPRISGVWGPPQFGWEAPPAEAATYYPLAIARNALQYASWPCSKLSWGPWIAATSPPGPKTIFPTSWNKRPSPGYVTLMTLPFRLVVSVA
jgi:hypothetical protein